MEANHGLYKESNDYGLQGDHKEFNHGNDAV